jgi:thioredoxin-related protein
MIERELPPIRSVVSVLVGTVLISAVCAPSRAGGPVAIDWRADYTQARHEARLRNLPLWIQFTGSWCHFCTRMERESFTRPRVIQRATQSFVTVKVQADAREDLMNSYGVMGLPATVILNPSGQMLAKHEGYVDGERFVAFLDKSLSRLGPRHAVEAERLLTDASVREVALAGFCPVSLVREPGARAAPRTRTGRAGDRAFRANLSIRQHTRAEDFRAPTGAVRSCERRPLSGEPGRRR